MTNESSQHSRAHASFDANEEQWFAQPRRESRRPSSRPAPSATTPQLDDSIADGWFYDVG